MVKKDIDAIYILMQNVSDKLGNLSSKIEAHSQNKNEPEIKGILESQKATLKYLAHLNNGLEKAFNSEGKNVNNYNEYVLFGKDSTMNSRIIFVLATIVLVAWFGFKYLVPFFSDQDKIAAENRNYEMMYDYLYLKNARNEPNNLRVDILMQNINTRDEGFLKEFYAMVAEHRKEVKRIELENELKKLK